MKYRIVKRGVGYRVQYKHNWWPWWAFVQSLTPFGGVVTETYWSEEKAREVMARQMQFDREMDEGWQPLASPSESSE